MKLLGEQPTDRKREIELIPGCYWVREKKKKARLSLCHKAKRDLADFSSKCKEASGKETD